MEEKYIKDIEEILSRRKDLGWDYWTTPDRRLIKGSPFSTLESLMYLLELGMDRNDPILQEGAKLIFEAFMEDGRFRLYPKGATYPCQTISAANVLCHLGYVEDKRIRKTFEHLLGTRYEDGGWRCNKFSYGHGPETLSSNPLPTLSALDAFRFSNQEKNNPSLDRVVDFLLDHWTIKKPIGPCHYGIGTLFMEVEYPFRGYNLFYYVYVLSFYQRARQDRRFLEAFEALSKKLKDEMITVERVVPRLRTLNFCRKGQPSELATRRYQEILQNLKEERS